MTTDVTAAQTRFLGEEKAPVAGWIAAAILVAVLHVLLAWVLMHLRDNGPNGTENPPAIMIELAPLPVAPPAVEKLEVPEAPAKTEEAPPEDMKPPEPEAAPAMPEPAPPLAEQPPPPAVVPEAPLAPKPAVVLAQPKQAPPKPVKKVEKPLKREKKPAMDRTAAPRQVEAAPSRRAAAPSREAGNPSVSSAEWGAEVRARIMAAKSCGAASGSGTASVAISISAGGGFAGAHISGSSGNAALDAQALSIARHAAPFPATPSGSMGIANIPIHFSC